MTTQTPDPVDNLPPGKPPFLVRRRTTFTWIIPLILLAVVFGLKPNAGGWAAWSAGVILVVLGEVVRFWAAGYIAKDSEIATGGPYAFVRNPLYFGSLLLTTGYALVSGLGWPAAVVLVGLFLLFHLAAIGYEEAFLKAKFGAAYLDYLRRVPRLLPSPVPRASGSGGWSGAQALRNREHVSAGFALVLTVLLSLRFLLVH